MPRYRHALPQLSGPKVFLTDGGLETTLVFLDGIDLPGFAAFPLCRGRGRAGEAEGRISALISRPPQGPAPASSSTRRLGAPMPTGARRSAIRRAALAEINRQSVAMAADLRDAWATQETPIVLNGVLGPRGDGYRADARMSADEAQGYHAPQIEAFRDGEADMISAITMTYPEEAVGIAARGQGRRLCRRRSRSRSRPTAGFPSGRHARPGGDRAGRPTPRRARRPTT